MRAASEKVEKPKHSKTKTSKAKKSKKSRKLENSAGESRYDRTAPAKRESIRKQIFPERKLRSLSPNFYIHVLWAIYIFPRLVSLFCCIKIGGPIVGIYKSQTHTWM